MTDWLGRLRKAARGTAPHRNARLGTAVKIKTEVCTKHRHYSNNIHGNLPHAYRAFGFGEPRRCPYQAGVMADLIEAHFNAPPSVEVQTLDELRRIRQLLEGRDIARLG